MSEIYLSKNIISNPQEDGDGLFLGKIRQEDLKSEDLVHQLEQTCDDLLKQNLLKESESEIGLDELLSSVDIIENELDKKFDKKLGVSQVFWKKVLRLLDFFNEVLGLNLDLKLKDELIFTKEKEKRKSLLFSFFNAIQKKLLKKELTLEEMLELQIKALEEQLASENDPELIHQIKKQLEFLMELKTKLFELSLEQSLNRTAEWLFTIGAMQTVAEMARGEYKAKEITITKGQWQKVESLLSSGKLTGQIGNVAHSDRGIKNVKTKPFGPIKEQNNNLNLIPLSQNIAKDNSGFLKLLHMLLTLANVYAAKHMELGMGKKTETTTQKVPTAAKANDQAQKQTAMEQNKIKELQMTFSHKNQEDNPRKQQPSSYMQKVSATQLVNNSKIYEK